MHQLNSYFSPFRWPAVDGVLSVISNNWPLRLDAFASREASKAILHVKFAVRWSNDTNGERIRPFLDNRRGGNCLYQIEAYGLSMNMVILSTTRSFGNCSKSSAFQNTRQRTRIHRILLLIHSRVSWWKKVAPAYWIASQFSLNAAAHPIRRQLICNLTDEHASNRRRLSSTLRR